MQYVNIRVGVCIVMYLNFKYLGAGVDTSHCEHSDIDLESFFLSFSSHTNMNSHHSKI